MPIKQIFSSPIRHNIQAIAFDLDGTLVDSTPGLTVATNQLLTYLNMPNITEQQIKNWIGNGIRVLLERVFSSLNVTLATDTFEQAISRFNGYYDKAIYAGTQLFPHVKETLQKLKENQYPMALVTNKPAQFLPELLTFLNINDYFQLVVGGGDVIKLKPHPAPLYQVMASFGLFSDQLLFVGDSKNDIAAGKNANCPTIGLSYGYNYGEPIEKSQPDAVFDEFKDILTILSLPRAQADK